MDTTYGIISYSHFKPIQKHLPDGSYEIVTFTVDDCERLKREHDIEKHVRLTFTVGFFYPAIYIPHGIADKGLRDVGLINKQIVSLYNGPAAVSELIRKGAKPEKLKVVGYPLLDEYFEKRKNRSVNKKMKVAWCPTHAPTDLSVRDLRTSYRRFNAAYLQNYGFDVITSLHPHNQDCRNYKISVENFYDADAVISDTSSVIYEALALGIPVILTKWLVKEIYGTERDIYSRKKGNEVCWLANSPEEIVTYLNRIKAGLGQGPNAKEFMAGVFPEELRGRSGKKAAEVLLSYL
ncbi:MAG: hypothetical protein WC373_17645 [Smithella sp.]|jgi:hypothetical protein